MMVSESEMLTREEFASLLIVGNTCAVREPPAVIPTKHSARLIALSRIAQLDQRTALPDQCLHSAEADVRPPRRKSGFETQLGHSTGNP